MRPEPNRLFFALVPPEGLRQMLHQTAQALHSTHSLGGRLLKPHRYHITLYFLGDAVPVDVETAAIEAARGVKAPPFNLLIDKADSFPNPRGVIAWLGPNEPPTELDYLANALKKALSALPRQRQPGFTPHLTVVRDAQRPLQPLTIDPIVWAVNEFVLIRSILPPQPAPRYEVIVRYPLVGPELPPTPKQTELPF